MRKQTFSDEATDKNVNRHRERANDFCLGVLRRLSSTVGLDAVLSANVDYWQDASLKNACRDLHIPFLVLCREHSTTAATIKENTTYYRQAAFHFKGDGVAVFGPSTRSVFVESGLCDSSQVWVTGPPRLDVWSETETAALKQDKIVLMTFFGYGADTCLRQIIEKLACMSRGKKRTQFVVKCKGAEERRVAELLVGVAHSLKVTVAVYCVRMEDRTENVAGGSPGCWEAVANGRKDLQ